MGVCRGIITGVLCAFATHMSVAQSITLSQQQINVMKDDYRAQLIIRNTANEPQWIELAISPANLGDNTHFSVTPNKALLAPDRHLKVRVVPRKGFLFLTEDQVLEHLDITHLSEDKDIITVSTLPIIYQGAELEEEPWKRLSLLQGNEHTELVNHSGSIVLLKSLDDASSRLTITQDLALFPGERLLLDDAINRVELAPLDHLGQPIAPFELERLTREPSEVRD